MCDSPWPEMRAPPTAPTVVPQEMQIATLDGSSPAMVPQDEQHSTLDELMQSVDGNPLAAFAPSGAAKSNQVHMLPLPSEPGVVNPHSMPPLTAASVAPPHVTVPYAMHHLLSVHGAAHPFAVYPLAACSSPLATHPFTSQLGAVHPFGAGPSAAHGALVPVSMPPPSEAASADDQPPELQAELAVRSFASDPLPTVAVAPLASNHVQLLGLSIPPSSPPAGSPNSKGICWGSLLLNTDQQCDKNFRPGTNHFKNKFCYRCRNLLRVPISRLRAITPQLAAAMSITTKMCAGFWKDAPPAIGGPRFRILNNTMMCTGPWIACFEAPPIDIEYAEFPAQWISDTGYVSLRVAKGTLVPVQETMKIARWGTVKRKADEVTAPEAGPAEGDAGFAGDTDSFAESSFTTSRLTEHGDGIESDPLAAITTRSIPAASPDDSFVDRYVDAHRRMSLLIEEHLLSGGNGTDVPPDDERTHLTAQLQLSRALTAAAIEQGLTQWQ